MGGRIRNAGLVPVQSHKACVRITGGIEDGKEAVPAKKMAQKRKGTADAVLRVVYVHSIAVVIGVYVPAICRNGEV